MINNIEYKVGDKVKIKSNVTGHGFKIGQIVTVCEVQDYEYGNNRIERCQGDDDDRIWCVVNEDVETAK